jgi:hypothetical protein
MYLGKKAKKKEAAKKSDKNAISNKKKMELGLPPATSYAPLVGGKPTA